MFDGSLIATISDAPARLTGMTWCFSRDLLGDQLDDLGVDLEVLQVDRRDAVLLGEEVGELGLLDEAELGQVVPEAAARLLLLVLRLLQLLQRDQVLADQQLTETSSHALHPGG